jgi:hypothetical protein
MFLKSRTRDLIPTHDGMELVRVRDPYPASCLLM